MHPLTGAVATAQLSGKSTGFTLQARHAFGLAEATDSRVSQSIFTNSTQYPHCAYCNRPSGVCTAALLMQISLFCKGVAIWPGQQAI